MLKPFSSRAALILLSTTLTVLGVGCRDDKQTIASPSSVQPINTATSSTPAKPKQAASPATAKPEPVAPSSTEPSSYEQALDKGYSAYSISQSAQSLDDWNLVIAQWQDAIALLKAVPKNSSEFAQAQTKITEYKRNLNYAKEQATRPTPVNEPESVVVAVPQPIPAPIIAPPPTVIVQEAPPPAALDYEQEVVFAVPIKRRAGGTPVIDVTFNGNQPFEMIVDTGASGTVITQQMAAALGVVAVGKAKANTASAKAIEFPIGYVDSIQAGGAVINNVAVAIAGSQLDTGLLGHDFFGDYDVTIKRDVVEFRPR